MCRFERPKDEDGNTLPHDHPSLVGQRLIIRHICPSDIVPDDNTGGFRLSSAVFQHRYREPLDHLSFDSQHCLDEKAIKLEEHVDAEKHPGSLSISVQDFREEDPSEKPENKWKIGMVPVPGNDCHGGVWGKISGGVAKKLQRKAEWVRPIDGVAKLPREED